MNLELVKLVLSWMELGKPPSSPPPSYPPPSSTLPSSPPPPPSWDYGKDSDGKNAGYGYGKNSVNSDDGEDANAGDVEDVDDSFLLCEQSAPSYPAWHSQWPITHSPLPGKLS